MFNRLSSLLSARFGRGPEADLFEGYVDLIPASPPLAIPPAQRWHVAMPGKHRPYLLADSETEADAITALEDISLSFERAGWTLNWQSESVCDIRKPYPEGLLVSRLEVVTGTELALRH